MKIDLSEQLKDKKLWLAALAQHERAWRKKEKVINCNFSRPESDIDDLRKVLSHFSVSRTIKSENLSLFRQLAMKPKRLNGRTLKENYEDFSEKVAFIANEVGKNQKKAGKTKRNFGRPISAASKVLFQRFPDKGYIYDRNARVALGLSSAYKREAINVLEEFSNEMVRHFGDRLPTIQKIIKSNTELHAARLVDKFLWLAGGGKALRCGNKKAEQDLSKMANKIAKLFK